MHPHLRAAFFRSKFCILCAHFYGNIIRKKPVQLTNQDVDGKRGQSLLENLHQFRVFTGSMCAREDTQSRHVSHRPHGCRNHKGCSDKSAHHRQQPNHQHVEVVAWTFLQHTIFLVHYRASIHKSIVTESDVFFQTVAMRTLTTHRH